MSKQQVKTLTRPWQMALVVRPDIRQNVVRFSKERNIRIPSLVSAVIERVFDDEELLISLLSGRRFPKRYGRNEDEMVVCGVEEAPESSLELANDLAVVLSPETSSEPPSRESSLEASKRVLEEAREAQNERPIPLRRDPGPTVRYNLITCPEEKKRYVDQGLVIESNADRAPGEGGQLIPFPRSPAFGEAMPIEKRRTSWTELCRMTALPGDNLDDELDRIQEQWEERWGEPTEEEVGQMATAVLKRRQVYTTWRELHRQLRETVETLQCCEVPSSRQAKRQLTRKLREARSELRVFELRTRWDERKLSEIPPWKAALRDPTKE